MSLPSNLPPLELTKNQIREQNAIARDVRRRYLACERETARWASTSTSHGAPLPLPLVTKLLHQLERILLAIRKHCIIEFWDSMTFRRKMLDVTAATFIQDFDECKTCLLRIMPYLEFHGIQASDIDGEVET